MDRVEALNDAGRAHLEQLGALVGDGRDRVPLDDMIVPTDDPAVAELVREMFECGQLSSRRLDEVGARCGVTGRTMRNRVNRVIAAMGDSAVPDRQWDLSPEMVEVIAAHRGRVAPAYQDLITRGVVVPSLSTMWRRWQQQPAAFRAFITHGKDAMLASWAYVAYTAPHLNAVWQGDYVPLPIDVIPAGYETTIVMPQVLVFEDDRTRAVTAWSVECRPKRRGTSALSVATLAAGFEGTVIDGVRVGGVPEVVRVDNDSAFVCDEMTDLAATVGLEIAATPPYSPFMKGKVERVGKTLQDECVALLQGHTHGPLTYSGRNPFRDGGPITEAALVGLLDEWFTHYNRARIHSQLSHGTPLREWAAAQHPVRWGDPAVLARFQFPIDRPHKVHKQGIWRDGAHWTGPGITALVGRKVTLRHPRRPVVDRLEVFLDDKWVMTARRASDLTDEERHEILRERRAIYSDALDVVENAAARRADATADAVDHGGLVSPASAPDVDTYSADIEALWAIVSDDPDAADTTDTPLPGPPGRARRRTPRRPIASRRRTERPDPGPADDLWGLFDDADDEGADGGGDEL